MNLLIALIVGFVLIVFVVNFPRQTLGCLGVAIVGTVLLAYWLVIEPELEQSRLQQQVSEGDP